MPYAEDLRSTAAELEFTVLGQAGEEVEVSVVSPMTKGRRPQEGTHMGVVLQFIVTVGAGGSTAVICADSHCGSSAFRTARALPNR